MNRKVPRDAPPVQGINQGVPLSGYHRIGAGAAAAPPDVQAIAILAFLYVANKAVDTCNCLGGAGRTIKAQIILNA